MECSRPFPHQVGGLEDPSNSNVLSRSHEKRSRKGRWPLRDRPWTVGEWEASGHTHWPMHSSALSEPLFHAGALLGDTNTHRIDGRVHVHSLSHVWLCNPMDCSLPGSSAHGVLQAGIWSGLPCPSPGDLPNPGIEPKSPASPALAGVFTSSITWEVLSP